MWTLMKYEYKKLYSSRIQKLMLLLVFLIPIGYGMLVIDSSEIEKQLTYYTKYEGTVNEAWFKLLNKDLQNQAGTDQDERSASILNLTLMEPYTVGKIWNVDDTNKERTENLLMEPESYPNGVSAYMNTINHFQFAPYYHWDLLINIMTAFGVLFAVYLTILLAPIVSSENNHEMMAIIQTTTKGKKQVGTCKFICSLSIAILVPIVMLAGYVVYIWVRYGLAHGDVSLAVYRCVNPYTFYQAVLYSTGIILLGSVAICAITFCISSFFKNTYISMVIAMILLLSPMFLSMNIDDFMFSQLFPFFYMIVTNVFIHFPFITFQETTMLYKDFLPMLWLPLIFILFGFSLCRYRHYQ